MDNYDDEYVEISDEDLLYFALNNPEFIISNYVVNRLNSIFKKIYLHQYLK